MKQQKFLFVDIISSFFLLLILIGNFMGLLYITEGNLALSLLGSLVLVVCYYFAVEQLKKNKEACANFAKAKELGDEVVDGLIQKYCK